VRRARLNQQALATLARPLHRLARPERVSVIEHRRRAAEQNRLGHVLLRCRRRHSREGCSRGGPIRWNGVRLAVVTALVVLTLVGAEGATAEAPPPPTITLLTPANGAVIESAAELEFPTFSWRIDWPGAPTSGTYTISWRRPAHPNLTQADTLESHSCPVQNLNCWSLTPAAVYGPPYGSVWYWQVSIVGVADSPVRKFKAVNPPDKDSDGVADRRDNCPSVSNASQRDSNRDGRGDACQPDRSAPRVRALAGSAVRGEIAFFGARVGDDRGEARMAAEVAYRGSPVLHGSFGFQAVAWSARRTFVSKQPVSRLLPAGTYRYCATAWDRAGNRARSCADYRIR
jgi:Thrombospondin type 3 repeat